MARVATRPRGSEPRDIFDRWFSNHRDELRAYTTRLTGDPVLAEDVVQETFARAWQHLDELRDRDEIGAWLYRVARNLCIDSHRRGRRLVATATHTESAHPVRRHGYEELPEPSIAVEQRDKCELVREAFDGLSPRYRDILYLRDVEGLAYQELAERTGMTYTGARALLARARRRLRDQLKVHGRGFWGMALGLRLRATEWMNRVGDRAPQADPVTAAVAQYMVAAAAVAGLALGVGAPPAGSVDEPAVSSSRPVVSSTETPASDTAESPDHRSSGMESNRPPEVEPIPVSSPADDASDAPRDGPQIVIEEEVGPDEGLSASPYHPEGEWVDVNATLHPTTDPDDYQTVGVVKRAAAGECAPTSCVEPPMPEVHEDFGP